VFLDLIYALILFFVKIVLKIKYDVTCEGFERVPKKGPGVFLCNHTSIVDSFLIGCFFPRKLYFMAKSTEFQSGVKRLFFYLSRSFPVRRYDIDPIALKNAFRVLDFGAMVGIYPEGERTWDGEMLPFRRGTIRFLLAAGVPIIPAAISGAYYHQPRWEGKIGSPEITIRVGEPILAAKIRGKDQTEDDIDSLDRKIKSTITALMTGA
jgi:1-acyl-sn-glycerol-3-phosphate acyltransferase